MAAPRWATPRNRGRATRGAELAAVANLLGFTDLHPWQRDAFDTMFEVDRDGRLWYQTCVLLVPRRAGKTIIDLTALVHRAQAFDGPQRSISTMQSGIASREMFKNTWVPRLEESAFAGLFTPTYQISHEQILWRNRSLHVVAAPTEKAGVGGDYDLWVCDEAWAHKDSTLEGAITPTMATREQPQTIITSMAGDDGSLYLASKRDLGRALVDAGTESRTFYLEFSAPEEADPTDRAIWWATHPALGRTIGEDRLAAFLESMGTADFAKEFLGIWPKHGPSRAVPGEAWRAREDRAVEHGPRVVLAVAVSPDRDRAAIVAASVLADGRCLVEVTSRAGQVDHRLGTGWVVPRLLEIVARVRPAAVALDAGGPAGSLLADLEAPAAQRALEAAGVAELTKLSGGDYARACGAAFDDVAGDEPRLVHLGQPGLDEAVAGVSWRRLGDRRAWARLPGEDITPWEAATVAAWVARGLPAVSRLDWLSIDV